MKLRVAVFALALATPAMAQPSLTPPVPERNATAQRWYGTETLIADGVGVGILLLAVNTEKQGLLMLGVAELLVASPVIHLVHENFGRGLASGLLVRPVIALGTMGLLINSCIGAEGCEDSEAMSILVGGTLAGALFDTAIAYEDVRVTPFVAPDGGKGMALVGTF